MTRIAYVNGLYCRHAEAAVAIEDRGNQFSDAIYEVCAVLNGQILDFAPHVARLHRSLGELSISFHMPDAALEVVMKEVVRRNRVRNGIVYIQISRGVAPRDHGFPDITPDPTVVMTAKRIDIATIQARQKTGVSVISRPEFRWGRPDIKSTSLLPNVLAKQEAHDAGAHEAWFVTEDGSITEGTSSNAWIVTTDGRLMTRKLDGSILPGITRAAVLQVANETGLEVEEGAFSLAEAQNAAEAFITSTTNFVMPVVRIDDTKVGDGSPGPVSRAAAEAYWQHVRDQTGYSS